MPAEKIYPVCSGCGGTDVKFDAWVVWDHNSQQYDLDNTFDDTFCEDCDGSCSVKWLEGDPPETP